MSSRGKGKNLLDVSRRGFLKGAAALAAAPAITLKADQPAADADIQKLGPGEVACELDINGKQHKLKVEPRVTLLSVLRDKLDMTGTKEVCDRGACGACTVHLDGKPVNSCMMLAMDAVGHKLTTVEGLATGDTLDPVQAAFVKHDALQCGYCTPGFVMSIKSLLAKNPKPNEMEVRKACSGNICRCGTYNKIFEAAFAAAGIATPVGNEKDNGDKCVENHGCRVDAPLKVTGRAKYTADINLPNMAYAAIVACPYGRAKLKSFDLDAAKAVKGVLDVVVDKRKGYVYCGQPTGHVCAETRQALNDAIDALKLTWNVETPITNGLEEHEKSEGAIDEQIDKAGGFGGGSAKKARKLLSESKKVVKATYSTQIQTHACLEPHCAVADYRGDSGELWVSSQVTAAVTEAAKSLFGLKGSQVKGHCEYVGGGFGSKFNPGAETRVAAELSKKLKRPIKLVNDRKREHLDTGCRPGSIQYMAIALDDKGKPAGGHVHVAGISGVGGGGGAPNPSRYEFGSVVKSEADIELSAGGARPMRAPGHPQAMFAVDSMVDELALAAGKDPIAYRKMIDPSKVRKKMYDVGAERIGWANRPKPDGAGEGRLKRGVGVGVADWGNGPGSSQIRVDVFKDGTVKVLSGTQDIGTGTRTFMADLLASHMKIDRKLITADCGNSDYPPGPGSGGSMVSRTIALSIRDAGDKAMKELETHAPDGYKDGDSWKAACRKIPGESFTVMGNKNNKYFGEGGSEAVQFAEVEVDIETGEVHVKRVVAIQACGLPVNRLTAESQVIGGVIQGVSYALHEEKILDKTTGAMVNANLEQYKITGPVDCPEIIPILWREGENLGVRSLGEPPVVPTAGAIANAVANAIGARVRSLPITPAKVLAALAEAKKASEGGEA